MNPWSLRNSSRLYSHSSIIHILLTWGCKILEVISSSHLRCIHFLQCRHKNCLHPFSCRNCSGAFTQPPCLLQIFYCCRLSHCHKWGEKKLWNQKALTKNPKKNQTFEKRFVGSWLCCSAHLLLFLVSWPFVWKRRAHTRDLWFEISPAPNCSLLLPLLCLTLLLPKQFYLYFT